MKESVKNIKCYAVRLRCCGESLVEMIAAEDKLTAIRSALGGEVEIVIAKHLPIADRFAIVRRKQFLYDQPSLNRLASELCGELVYGDAILMPLIEYNYTMTDTVCVDAATAEIHRMIATACQYAMGTGRWDQWQNRLKKGGKVKCKKRSLLRSARTAAKKSRES